jgi:hypothetical protein
MTEGDIESACAEIDTVRYDLQVEADVGHEWLPHSSHGSSNSWTT